MAYYTAEDVAKMREGAAGAKRGGKYTAADVAEIREGLGAQSGGKYAEEIQKVNAAAKNNGKHIGSAAARTVQRTGTTEKTRPAGSNTDNSNQSGGLLDRLVGGLETATQRQMASAKAATDLRAGVSEAGKKLLRESAEKSSSGYTAADVAKMWDENARTSARREQSTGLLGGLELAEQHRTAAALTEAEVDAAGKDLFRGATKKLFEHEPEAGTVAAQVKDNEERMAARREEKSAAYTAYNTWLEQGDNRELAAAVERVQGSGGMYDLDDLAANSDWTAEQIAEAAQMVASYEDMGLYAAGRRVSGSAKSVGKTVASAPFQAIEAGRQAFANVKARRALNTGERENDELLKAVERMRGSGGQYDLDDLAANSDWTMDEILAAAAALDEAAAPVSQESLGYQIWRSGQEDLADAMLGESDAQRFIHGAALSAGENLALAAVNPALVLPALTAQSVADALGEAAAEGTSAGRALGKGTMSGIVSYGVEQLGVAQMAKNMGRGVATSVLTDEVLDALASAPGLRTLAEKSPWLYGVLANAGDEAIEEFTETYAGALGDALIGEPGEESAGELLRQALESAAGGAVGGAMIGGVSGGMGRAASALDARKAAKAQQEALSAAQAQQEAARTEQEGAAEADLFADAEAAEMAGEQTEDGHAAGPSEPGSLLDDILDSGEADGGRLDGRAWEALEAAQGAGSPGGTDDASMERGESSPAAQTAAGESWAARRQAWGEEEYTDARLLAENTRMSEAAITTAVEAMPDEVSRDIYLTAANEVYQIARQGLAETADEALRLAEAGGVRAGQVLAAPGGEAALRQIYNQGRIEGIEAAGYGQAGLADESRAGQAAYEKSALVSEEDRTLIDLFAAASDTSVTVAERLENNAGGYIDTAAGQVFFGAGADADTFGTILHESTHLYNAFDEAGGRELQTALLRALAEEHGFETVDELAESYIQRYQQAGQDLSYAQACEEITADAMRGVMDSEEAFGRWVEKQKAFAAENAGNRSIVRKIMDAMRELLDRVAAKAKSILARQPDNEAARLAARLAAERKAALEQQYYRHAETALAAQRAARQAGTQADAQAGAETKGEVRSQLRDNKKAAQYPQADWTGRGDAAYKTLTALPDMQVTAISEIKRGKTKRDIIDSAFVNMGMGPEATRATVTNRYTGAKTIVGRDGIKHSFHEWQDIKTRGPYVQQIGSILENAVKINEMDARTGEKGRGESRSDVYLGAAENEKGELVGVRFVVNVYENGRAELVPDSVEPVGKLYGHRGAKMGVRAAATPHTQAVSRTPLVDSHANIVADGEQAVNTISVADLVDAIHAAPRTPGIRDGMAANDIEGMLSEDVKAAIGSEAPVPKGMTGVRYQLGDERRAGYPQADWTGKGDAAYKTLTALPDMQVTAISEAAVEGKSWQQIRDEAFRNMGAAGMRARVTNRYTGAEIGIDRGGLEHSFHSPKHIESRGPYTLQIGSILENAVKVNEMDVREKERRVGIDHSDVYLGVAENEKGELVGVRLVVNVYENGRAELVPDSVKPIHNLASYLGRKIGDAEASPDGIPALKNAGVRRFPEYSIPESKANANNAASSYVVSITDLINAVKDTQHDPSRSRGMKDGVDYYDIYDVEGMLSEDVKAAIGSEAPVPKGMTGVRYQLPVDEGAQESGARAASYENIDRPGIVDALEAAYSEMKVQRIPAENIQRLTGKLLRGENSRADRATVTKQLDALAAYMADGRADYDTALAGAEGIADVIMRQSGRLDRTLWNEYKDLHYFTVGVKKGGPEYKELVYRYGSYATAKKELAHYGITVTTGKPGQAAPRGIDQVYKELAGDWPGLFSADVTGAMEQLDVIAQVRESIRPVYTNDYGGSWDEAKADLALRIVGGLVSEGVTDASAAAFLNQKINESLNSHRARIQQRALVALGAQERRAREKAVKAAQKIVDEAGQRHKEESEAWAKTEDTLRTRLAATTDTLGRARDARSKDNLRRGIAANQAKLNRMLLHPSEKQHVPRQYLEAAVQVAQIANSVTRNDNALLKLQALQSELAAAAKADGGTDSIAADWDESGIYDMMTSLTDSMKRSVQGSQRLAERAEKEAARLAKAQSKMEATTPGREEWYAEYRLTAPGGENNVAYLDSMTVEQLRLLSDMVSAMVTVAQNSNRLLATQTAQDAAEFAQVATEEVETSAGRMKEKSSLFREWREKYIGDTTNATRQFERLGGYRHGGAMEALGRSLAAGEAKQTAIREKGMRIFEKVLAADKETLAKRRKFSGRGAELIDVGLKDEKGKAVLITRAQNVSLYKHLQHEQNRRHAVEGGVVVPDMRDYAAGRIERAYRNKRVAHLGTDSIARIGAAMDDYDLQWSAALDELLNHYTKDTINETSRRLSGYERAKVENYYPITVDPRALAQEIEGLKFNGTIEGRGFLKERKQGAAQPILLEECNAVAARSLADAAAYGGLAPAIRDMKKVYNANAGGSGSLIAAIEQSYGENAVEYVNKYLTDLQTSPRGRRSILDGLDGLRGRYAGAVLTFNYAVALGQFSGLPTAAAELGWGSTMGAAGDMLRNLSGKQLEKTRAEMTEHGYWQLESVMSDGATAELAAMRRGDSLVQRAMQRIPGVNALEAMDAATRAACWEGSKDYVTKHLDEYGLDAADAEKRSEAWWDAVVEKMTVVNDRTQPNYTVSQRAGIQRNPDKMAKMFAMFKTQNFQNWGILTAAVGDYNAQRQYVQQAEKRLAEKLDADTRTQAETDLKRAEADRETAARRLRLAVTSQVVQQGVFVAASMLVKDLFLHRWDEDKDENGDVTAGSVAARFAGQTVEGLLGNALFMGEALSIAGNLFGERDDSPISLTGIDAITELTGDLYSVSQALFNGEEDPEEAARKLRESVIDLAGSAGNLTGLPVAQMTRYAEAVAAWVADFKAARDTDATLADIRDAPVSSSSQYDRLYTAVFENPDGEEAAAAIEKLRQLDRVKPPAKAGAAKAADGKILTELLNREAKYGSYVKDAAAARVAGDEAEQRRIRQELVDTLAGALGIDPGAKDGQRRLRTVIDKADDAIGKEVRAQMGQDSDTGATVYTPLLTALDEGGDTAAVQQVLRRAGVDDSAMRSAVVSEYKEDYLYSDEAGRAEIERRLLTLRDSWGEPYFEKSEEKDDFAEWVTDWTLQGDNESVYTDLDEALSTRNAAAAKEEIWRYMEAGKSAESIRTRISELYKKAYRYGSAAERSEIARFVLSLRGVKGEKLITTDTLRDWMRG